MFWGSYFESITYTCNIATVLIMGYLYDIHTGFKKISVVSRHCHAGLQIEIPYRNGTKAIIWIKHKGSGNLKCTNYYEVIF